MAVKKIAADDPRTPDTVADAGGSTPELDKGAYGFRTIEESEAAQGPGAVEPTVVESVSSVPNSTFASRAGKAVQSAENK